MSSSESSSGPEEGTAYFYKCTRCRIKFHEYYIVLPAKMCAPCLKLSKYVCELCGSASCTPSYCSNQWKMCKKCCGAYHEDYIIDGTCDYCR